MTPLMMEATMSGTMTIFSAFMKSLPKNRQKLSKVAAKLPPEAGRMSRPKSAARPRESSICQCSFQRRGFIGVGLFQFVCEALPVLNWQFFRPNSWFDA